MHSDGWSASVLTERLELRPPVESDRPRFIELFGDESFMVFSEGVLDAPAASARFDGMLVRAAEIRFAKQPVIVRDTGEIVGYAGVDRIDFEGESRLEFGWRLIPEVRGRGYASEAASALLASASETFAGEIIAMIDPTNEPSQRVAAKVGFVFWKLAEIDGHLENFYRLQIA